MLRLVAGGCKGNRCDYLIPISVLMPLLILALVATTGLAAFSRASRTEGHRWAPALGVLTAVGVVGPIVALGLFRDNPDLFVLTATVLTGLLPVTALLYSFR